MGNPDFDSILTTTLNNHRPNLENNFKTSRPFVNWLFSKGRMSKRSGGATIVEPLLYAENSTAKSYSGYDNLDIAPQEGMTAAQYPWKSFAGTIAINLLEESINSGKEAVLNLLESKIDQLNESIHERFDVMMLGDGTGNSGKDWNGAANVIPTNPAVGSLGGIDPATNTWWRNVASDAASGVRTDDRWATAVNTASRGISLPDFGLTTQALWEHYESSLAPALRFMSNNEADARFVHLKFKGINLYWDVNVASGQTRFFDSKYIKLVGHSDVWFKNTPFVKPANQTARYSQVVLIGNLVTSNRSRHAVIFGQTV